MPDPRPKDIRDLAAAAVLFRDRLDKIKSGRRSPDFDWYPYNTFGVFPVLTPILREERRDLLALAGAGPVLDIGCGDGDLSFLFESFGCRVMAIDNPRTNYNRTLGFTNLLAALLSTMELEVSSIFARRDLGLRTFVLSVFLGVHCNLKVTVRFLYSRRRHATNYLL